MRDGRPGTEEDERRYTLSISEEERERSFKMEDDRWAREKQLGDWLKLALLVVISLAYHLLIFFLEPGLR
jgi:hypothetical protein